MNDYIFALAPFVVVQLPFLCPFCKPLFWISIFPFLPLFGVPSKEAPVERPEEPREEPRELTEEEIAAAEAEAAEKEKEERVTFQLIS